MSLFIWELNFREHLQSGRIRQVPQRNLRLKLTLERTAYSGRNTALDSSTTEKVKIVVEMRPLTVQLYLVTRHGMLSEFYNSQLILWRDRHLENELGNSFLD